MLRPHLEAIVYGALDNAITAKDPENYFMLLRSLFRSISGGVHERLYQQFLPLLPRLLRQMNQLQTALHRPEMHDLFIELCLTVPVRLSYLLPHMERLMEPLVAALKGTQNLVSQGLRRVFKLILARWRSRPIKIEQQFEIPSKNIGTFH